MSFIKNYLAPGKAQKKEQEKKAKQQQEKAVISEKVPVGGILPRPAYPSAINSPGNGTTPWGSRPGSIHPNDARRSQMEELNEIKCDVMVNWLYQQQMEKLWTAGAQDEGVVLKKSRGAYTCCPADIVDEPFGFYKAIQTLNVRVSFMQQVFDVQMHVLTADSVR